MQENVVRVLIYLHAALGGLALLFGSIALSTPKGNRLHRKTGLVFYYCMLSAAILSLIISMQPHHVNYFLFVIGVFSSYMILSGKRILKLKLLYKGMKATTFNYVLPVSMLAVGIGMIAYGVMLNTSGNNSGIVLMVFGGIGTIMSIGDIRMLRSRPKDRLFWLYQHISKMTGGYIAALTAFLVVNEVIPGLWAWLTPTVVGTLYIIYHQVRFRRKGQRILIERKIDY